MKYTIAKQAYPYIILFIFSGFLAMPFSRTGAGFLFFLAIYMAFFFRKPVISIQVRDGELVSPAWGKITSIEDIQKQGKPYKTISIFLSVFDVHMQCIPHHGTVQDIRYKKGRFINAIKPDSSIHNEQNSLAMKINRDDTVEIRQIAGLIARRISCWAQIGDKVHAGDYYGLIHFGSRVEVEIPSGYELLVKTGQRVQGGKTILAKHPGNENNKVS